MSNLLRDVFSNELPDMVGKLRFKDIESSNAFVNALRNLEEGKTSDINGVEVLKTIFVSGNISYSTQVQGGEITVSPAKLEPSVSLPINIHGEKSEIKFSILRQEDSFILERGKDDVLYLKLSFFTDKHMANYNYQYNLEKAKSIAEVAEETYVAIAVFDCITGLGDNPVSVGTDSTDIAHLKEPFQVTYAMLCKLCALEKELEIKFDPTQITDFDENTQDIEELFQLLVKKHVIRLNAKLTATESTKITFQKTDARLEVGENLDMTFTQEYEYLVYVQEIHIFTANYLGNAVVKKVEESEAGTYTIWYGDTDSKPMYISRTGFKTLDEARQENDRIMNRKEAYINAKMIHDYHDELGIPYADAIPNS